MRFAVKMGNCHTVGPNEALVISGGCCGNQGKKYLVGGYGWAWCFVTEVQRISLEIMTLLPSVTNCESAKGNVLHFHCIGEKFETFQQF